MNKELKSIRNLSREECIDVIKKCKTANVSFARKNIPYVRAVPFKLHISKDGTVFIKIVVYYDNEMVIAAESPNTTQISFSANYENEIHTATLKGTVFKKYVYDYCVEGFIADIKEISINGKAFDNNIDGYFYDDFFDAYRMYEEDYDF